MSVQLELFQTTTKEQKTLLNTLIELKTKEIEEKEFKNFFGTTEAISQKRIDVNKKINSFVEKVRKAFPGLV